MRSKHNNVSMWGILDNYSKYDLDAGMEFAYRHLNISGKIVYSTGYYTGSNSKILTNYSLCYGSGTCKVCYGKGRIN